MKKFLKITVGIFFLLPLVAAAQITIAPTNIFVSERAPFDSYIVINGSNQSQEISISFVYGYTTADSTGNRFLVYDDSVTAKQNSAAEWVRAFPRNFSLNPGQRQTVRLRVRPPNDLEDGVYWARVKTLATPLSPPIEVGSDDAVTARVGFKLEQVTGLYFKVGDVSTGINIKNLTAESQNNDNLQILADIERTGNAPFLGTIYTDILDDNNNVVQQAQVSTTIFFDELYRIDLNTEGLDPGTYTARVRFVTERNDIAREDLVQMEPVSQTTRFTIK